MSSTDALISNDVILSFDPSMTPTTVTIGRSGVYRITYRVSVTPNGASSVSLRVVVWDPTTSTFVYTNTQTGPPNGMMRDDVIVTITAGKQVWVESTNTATAGSFTVLAGAVLTVEQL